MMGITSGSQPTTLRPSWRSTSETLAVQAADAVDHVVAEAVEAAEPPVVLVVPVPAVKPLGQSVEEGLTR